MIYSNYQEQLWLELASSLSLLRGQGKRHLLFFPSEALRNYYQIRLAEALETTVDIDCCLLSEIFDQALEMGLLDQAMLQGSINESDFEWALTLILSTYQQQLQKIDLLAKTSTEDGFIDQNPSKDDPSDYPLIPLELLHSPLTMELRQQTSGSLYRLVKTLAKSFSCYAQQADSSRSFHKSGDWQSFLLKQVFELLAPKCSYVQLVEELIENHKLKTIEGLHFYFVGFSKVPPIVLSWIQNLASQYPVEWFLLSPCRLFWSDSGSFFSNQHTLAKAGLKNSGETLNQLESLLFDRHPLLANMAIAAKPLTQFLEKYQTTSHDAYVLPTDPHFHDLYLDLWWQDANIENQPTSLLRALQLDFLLLRTLESEIKVTLNPDSSLIVHQCPDPDREIALLKAYLLKLLHDDPTLHLGDILILAPNIHSYRGLIERHFEKSASILPYRIQDTVQIKPQGFIYTLQTLLRFAMGTWSFSSYIELLSLELLAKKEDAKKIIHFLEKAQNICAIHWGVDTEHHRQLADTLGLDPKGSIDSTPWQFFWEELLSYLLKGEEDSKIELKLATLGSSTLEEALNFHHYLLQGLKPWYRRQKLTLKNWIENVKKLIERFFISESYDIEKDRLDELFFSFQPAFKSESTLINCETFYDLLINRLESIQLPGSHLSENALRFSSMQPMRSVPAKHLCILGLSNDMRSHQPTSSHFEWSQDEGIAPTPSQMTLDRYSFLESILSARNSLHLFYSQSNPSSGDDSLEPSYLISELTDYLDQAFLFYDQGSEKTFSELLHLKHSGSWNSKLYHTRPYEGLFAFEKQKKENDATILESRSLDLTAKKSATTQEALLTKQQIVDLLTDPLAFHLRQNLTSIRSFYIGTPSQEYLLSANFSLETKWETLVRQNPSFFDQEKELFSESFEKILSKQKPSSIGLEAWQKKYQALEKRKCRYWKIKTSPILLNLSSGFDVLHLPDQFNEALTSHAFKLSASYPWKVTGEIGWIDPLHPHMIVNPKYKDKRIEGLIPYILAHHLGHLKQTSLMIYFSDETKKPLNFNLAAFDIQAWFEQLAKSATFFKEERTLFHIKLMSYLTQNDSKDYLKALIRLAGDDASTKRIALFLNCFGLSLNDKKSEIFAEKWLHQIRKYLLPLYTPFSEILGLKDLIEEEED